MSKSAADFRFGKDRRLLDAKAYSGVFAAADARASHRHLLLLARRNHRNRHRLGLVIAKKHVRRAVDRNRLKRIARESFRQLTPSAPSLDIVLLARPGLGELDNARVSSILQQQWQRLLRQCSNSPASQTRDS